MNRISIILLAIVLAWNPLLAQKSLDIYVAPSGSDKGAGSLQKPFRTIKKAIEAVGKNKKSSSQTIYLREGIHVLEEQLRIDPSIVSPNGGLTIRAYKHEKVIVSGGKKITGFEKVNTKLWKKKIVLKDFRDLYVRNKPGIRARYPDKGEYFKVTLWDQIDHKILVKAEETEPIDFEDDVEMRIHMNWAENIARVAKVDYTTKNPSSWTNPRYAKISFRQPEDSLLYKRNYPPKRSDLAYHFENSKGFISQAYEWFYDKKEQALYIQPHEYDDLNSFSVIVPQVDTLLLANGSLDNPLQNITVDGITFSHSNWSGPSDHGYIQLQTGHYMVNGVETMRRLPSAISFSYAKNITFTNNTLTNLSAGGIDYAIGVQNSKIQGNLFYNIGGNGVTMAQYSDELQDIHGAFNTTDERLISKNNQVADNMIKKAGIGYLGTSAIAVGFGQSVLIENNIISEMPWIGISIGWGWTSSESVMRNNVIRENHITRVCEMLCDCGGIYTLSAQPNSSVEENYIAFIDRAEYAGGSNNVALYADEGSTGILFKNNYIHEARDGRLHLKGDTHITSNEHHKPWVLKKAGPRGDYQKKLEERFEQIK